MEHKNGNNFLLVFYEMLSYVGRKRKLPNKTGKSFEQTEQND